MRHLRDGAVCVCGIDEMGATDRHWYTGPGCSFVGMPEPRDHERSIVRSPRCVYDYVRCPLPASIDTSIVRNPLGHQLQKPLGEFSPFHRVGPRVEYSTDCLCRLSLSNANSRRDLHSSLRSSDAAIQHLKFARVPSRLFDQRKGRMRRCTRKLRAVTYHQL